MAGDGLNARPVTLTIIAMSMLLVIMAYLLHNFWVTAVLAAVAMIIWYALIASYIKARRDLLLISKLAESQKPRESLLANRLLGELALQGSEKKPFTMLASELLKTHFHLGRFVIMFRESDKYVPRIYYGMGKNDLVLLGINRITNAFNKIAENGVLTNNYDVCQLAFKHENQNDLIAAVAFHYSWGRAKSVFMVADDQHKVLSETLNDEEFNRVFWPGLDYNLKMTSKLYEKNMESRQIAQELGQAKKDIMGLNKELKNKLLDLQSFVKISNDLYSLFNEEQLFAGLKNIILEQFHAERAEILVPSGEGKFVIGAREDGVEDNFPKLSLDAESEFSTLLGRAPKPILLPLVGSGLRHNEHFLAEALGARIQVASSIRVGGQTACILLVGQKNDRSHYTNQDLDYLYILSNIASLALDNIHQYSTIEKLSYTDSMTGIFNYRYFYKRLSEEILRAKRYNRELALVIMDIDNFKSFNDNYGHQAGDFVLKQLSDLITKTIRSIDIVSRYGGEEFCIIMPDTGMNNCETFIERLRGQIADFKFESELFPAKVSISVSVGGAVYPHHASMPDRLIYCADMALLKAKSMGRNRAVIFQIEFAGDTNSTKESFNENRYGSIP
jgi:diguanylate cyclase (GGDEF)-like protein